MGQSTQEVRLHIFSAGSQIGRSGHRFIPVLLRKVTSLGPSLVNLADVLAWTIVMTMTIVFVGLSR